MNDFKPTVNTAGVIAKIANVAQCYEAIKRTRERNTMLPGFAVFYGPSGFGKSVAANYVANKTGAYYVQAKSTYNKKAFLQAVLREMSIFPDSTMAAMADQIATELAKSGKPLIIDEFDHLVTSSKVEMVRDIYESSQGTILCIGEENLPKKLERWERFHGRVLNWVPAQPATEDDARLLCAIYSPIAHLLPVLEVIPFNVNSFYGLDFARKKNACSFWPLLEQPNTRKKCPFVFEMFNVPYKQQEKFLLLIVKMLPSFRKGAHDATGNGGYLAEAMQIVYGQRVEALHLTESWYRENTPPFKAALEDGDIEGIPADKDIKDDHSAFKLVKGVARIPAMGESNQNDKKRHGDSAIAHLLAKYASRNPDAPIEFEALPDREELERNPDNYDEWLSLEKGCF